MANDSQTSRRRVWQVVASPKDVSDARRFGDVLPPIFDLRVTSPHDANALCNRMKTHVLPFMTREDLVLTVGPQIMVLTVACVAMKKFGRANFLVWDSHAREYVERYVE